MKASAIWCVAALAVALTSVARSDTIRVRVNGDLVRFTDTQPMEMNGRVMIPLRGVLEQLGATVDWDSSENTVVASRGSTEIRLPIGSYYAHVNGREVRMDVPATTVEDRTMVPLRFVSEALGAHVTWDDQTQTALIQTGGTFSAYRMQPADNGHDRSHFSDIQPGTVIAARLDSGLSSDGSSAGDRFTVDVESGQDSAGLPDGTTIEGVVHEAIPAKGHRPGLLDVEFRRIHIPGWGSSDLGASLVSLDNKHVRRTQSGRLVARYDSQHDRMKWVGIGAGAGLLISAVAGGDRLLDTILGAGSGFLYNELQHGKPGNVVLTAGTRIGIRLDRELRIPPSGG